MRRTILMLALGLCGCAEPFGALAGADVASVVVFGRSIGDLGASAITGRDCSIVRLDRGQTYCAPRDRPRQDAFCTRTLATVDCWAVPPPDRFLVADTPPPTDAQRRYREARWPKTLTAEP